MYINSTALPKLEAGLLRELHVIDGRHAARIFLFILLGTLGMALACVAGQSLSNSAGRWFLLISGQLLAAASLHGISLFTHEAVHGTLSRNASLNAVLGALCAVPVLQNFSAYRVLHLRHHDHLGVEGDPDHYPNYTHWNWLLFLMNWGRLLIGYPVYICAIPLLGFKHGNRTARIGIVLELLLSGLFICALLAMPPAMVLHGWLGPMLIINFFVNVRGMSQHTLLEEHDAIQGTRTILTNPLTVFFMCNENYHLEHHLYPGVPWYHLPRLHRILKAELTMRGAPFIPSYFAFVKEFARVSFLRSPLGKYRREKKALGDSPSE